MIVSIMKSNNFSMINKLPGSARYNDQPEIALRGLLAKIGPPTS